MAHAYEEFIPIRSAAAVTWTRCVTPSSSTGEMVDSDGAVQAVGLEFHVLGPDGRIRTDYQFIES